MAKQSEETLKVKLLETTREQDPTEFCKFMQAYTLQKKRENLKLILSQLDQAEVKELSRYLCHVCELHMQDAISSGHATDKNQENFQKAIDVLLAVIHLIHAYLKKGVIITDEMVFLMVLLHSLQPQFHPSHEEIKNKIAILCELWWSFDLRDKESVVMNGFLYLLEKTLHSKAQRNDILRMWKMHGVLELIFSEEERCEMVLPLLLECVVSKQYLKIKEGRKLIAYILTLSERHVERFHDEIFRTLPRWTLTHGSWYGEIYLEAWKRSSGSLRKEIELKCIQEALYHAVHVTRAGSPSPADVVFKFVQVLHAAENDVQVHLMLYNLYKPILWKSLKVANYNVRLNAALIFFDVFPLRNPNFCNPDAELEHSRQIDVLMDLLNDPVPEVRSNAVMGASMVLRTKWQYLSSNALKRILKFMILDLCCDAASVETRVAVLKGLSQLLSNHLSHRVLKPVLPLLKNRIDDVSAKVRVAMCDLLLTVYEKAKSIEWWSIVPIELLVNNLAKEPEHTVRRIMKLISESYFSSSYSIETLLENCVALIKLDSAASKVFFLHLHECALLPRLVHFMTAVCAALKTFFQSKEDSFNQKRQKLEAAANKENLCTDEVTTEMLQNKKADHPLNDEDVVAGLLHAVAIILFTTKEKLNLPQNEALKNKLTSCFGVAGPVFLRVFQSGELWNTTIFILSLLPSYELTILSSYCLSKLKNLPEDYDSAHFSGILTSMYTYNRYDDVLELISDWLAPVLKVQQRSSRKKRRGRAAKHVRFAENQPPRPLLACSMLSHFLCNCTVAVLEQRSDQLKDIWELLQNSKDLIKQKLERNAVLVDDCTDTFLVRAFDLYLKMTVRINQNASPISQSVKKVVAIVRWAQKVIVPVISRSFASGLDTEEMSQCDQVSMLTGRGQGRILSIKLLQALLNLFINMLLVQQVNEEFCELVAKFSLELLVYDDERDTFKLECQIAVLVSKYLLFIESSLIDSLMPKMVNGLLQPLASNVGQSFGDYQEMLHAFKACLWDILKLLQSTNDAHCAVLDKIMSAVALAVINDVSSVVEKNLDSPVPSSIKELPEFGKAVLMLLKKKKNLILEFLGGLTNAISSSKVDMISQCISCVYLVAALKKETETDSSVITAELLQPLIQNIEALCNQMIQGNCSQLAFATSGSCNVSNDDSYNLQGKLKEAYSFLKNVEKGLH